MVTEIGEGGYIKSNSGRSFLGGDNWAEIWIKCGSHADKLLMDWVWAVRERENENKI